MTSDVMAMGLLRHTLQNTPLGRMLLHGVPAQTLQAEIHQLQMAAGTISHDYNLKLAVVKTPDTEQFLLSQDSIKLINSPSLPSLLGQSYCTSNVC